MDETSCFLCGLVAEKSWHVFDLDAYKVKCKRCGQYTITRECSFNVRSTDGRTLAAISAATRQATLGGTTLLLRMDNWNTVSAAHINTPVRQKVAKLLRYIARKSEFPGAAIKVEEETDYPAFDAASSTECSFLVRHIFKRGYLDKRGDDALTLSVEGWEQVDPPAGPAGIPGRCFVAMSFAQDLDEAYNLGIKPAIEKDCGMMAVRMKELEHNQDICDRLLSEIRQAQFLIADFTGHRNGVYYEAGFARAIGREVINCCRDTDFADLHFDTNHLNHIKWEGIADLRQKIANRIRATVTVVR
ncbi:MAG: hypothetical protein JST11_12200 [Acidobacteria bacterium]|nr:hypothetical protein [Acidobacteriota bacterium]